MSRPPRRRRPRPRPASPPRRSRRRPLLLERFEDRTLLSGLPVITVTAPVPTTVETIGDPAIFSISRIGPTDQPLAVAFTLGGRATFGVDYHLVGASAGLPGFANPGFEAPALADGGYGSPAGTGWTFSGIAGLSTDGTDYTSGNPPAPEGRQVALLHGAGAISQTVAVPAAGTYRLSLMAAQRGNYQPGGYHDFAVTVDGVAAARFRPAGTAYEALHVDLDLAAGTRAIALAGIDTAGAAAGLPPGSQNVSFVDDVRLERLAAETVWVDDALPAGAVPYADGGDAWEWVAADPAPVSGSLAARSAIAAGLHQQYFEGVAEPLAVEPGDVLFAHVWLDPAHVPDQVMLQWHDGSWEHRASWGADHIPWGTAGTASRRHMGPLPAAGGWVRLEVPASLVGLEGRSLSGLAFTLFGGRAAWDRAGVAAAPAGVDGPFRVVIPAGAAGATVGIVPVDDGIPEGIESVVLVLTAGPYAIGTPGAATVEIADSPSPGGLTATAISPTALLLSWRDIAGEAGYRIERSRFGFDWIPIGSVAADVTSFTVGDLSEGDIRRYRVVAFDGAGDFLPSAPVYGVIAWSAPVIVNPASAGPSVVTGTETTLSVLGAVAAGESTLRYTWSVRSMPAGASHPSFSENGTNAAKTTVATFSAAGDYAFRVEVANGSQVVTGDVAVTVQQALTGIAVGPPYGIVPSGTKRQYSARAKDQFGHDLANQPSFTWSVASGPGQISSGGLYAAPNSGGGSAIVRATAGGITGTASVDVTAGFTLRGDYVAAGVGLRGRTSGQITISGIPSGSTIKAAYLYWGYLDNGESPSLKSITFAGTALTGEKIGSGPDTCWGRTHSHSYWADVTDDVAGNGNYAITGVASGGSILGQGASLVVIYEDDADPTRTILLKRGHDVVRMSATATKSLDGFSALAPVMAKTTFIVGDGQPVSGELFTDRTTFTGTSGTATWNDTLDGSDGAYWDTDTYDVSSLITSGGSLISASIGGHGNDCLMWVAQVFSVTSFAPDLVAHRTGGKLGEAVAAEVKDGRDPKAYLILTNNDSEEDPAGARRDFDDDTAVIPTGSGPVVDDDLAKITLKQLPPSLATGTVEVILSNPDAVRLFRSDGTQLFRRGETGPGALTLDLANPTGYLAGLLSGDVDVWLEGLEADEHFVLAVVCRDSSGRVIAGDEVHLTIADWTFRGYHGEEVTAVAPAWKEALLAATRREDAAINADPDGAFFKAHIAGLPAGAITQLQVSSDAEPSDYYFDEFVDLPDRAVSRSFAALYSADRIHLADPDAPVTAAERDAIKQALDLNVVRNQGMTAVLTTGPVDEPTDIHRRTLAVDGAIEFALDDADGIYQVGDHVSGTIDARDNWSWQLYLGDTRYPGDSPKIFNFIVNTPGDYVFRLVFRNIFNSDLGAIAPPRREYVALIRVLPQGKTMPVWERAAWDALKVNGYVPGDPIQRNRRISQLYAEMYNSANPQPLVGGVMPTAFEWAGNAAFASNLAGDGMSKAEALRIADLAPDFVGAPSPKKLLEGLWQGNLTVFMDMYSQMLAYRESERIQPGGGIAEIQAMRQRREITAAQLEAWELIDLGLSSGDEALVWQGTLLHAKVEQGVTLQAVLDRDPELWRRATEFTVPVVYPGMTSPVPGDDSTFQQYRLADPFVPNNASFGDGTIYGDPNEADIHRGVARYRWFKERMVPAWKDNADAWRKTHGPIVVSDLLNGRYKRRP